MKTHTPYILLAFLALACVALHCRSGESDTALTFYCVDPNNKPVSDVKITLNGNEMSQQTDTGGKMTANLKLEKRTTSVKVTAEKSGYLFLDRHEPAVQPGRPQAFVLTLQPKRNLRVIITTSDSTGTKTPRADMVIKLNNSVWGRTGADGVVEKELTEGMEQFTISVTAPTPPSNFKYNPRSFEKRISVNDPTFTGNDEFDFRLEKREENGDKTAKLVLYSNSLFKVMQPSRTEERQSHAFPGLKPSSQTSVRIQLAGRPNDITLPLLLQGGCTDSLVINFQTRRYTRFRKCPGGSYTNQGNFPFQ